MDFQSDVSDEIHGFLALCEYFEVGLTRTGGEAEYTFWSDCEDEFALGVEMEDGFAVDRAADVDEVDRCPSFGQGGVPGCDPFGCEMVMVDHLTNFGRQS